MRHFVDWSVLILVEMWVIVTANQELRRLRRRQRRYGVRRVTIAVPRLADEKFLWRKLFDHDPRFVTLTDKVACKEWVAAQGFDVKMPKTLWTGLDANEIPEAVWLQPIYIKASHGWQMNIPVLSPPENRGPIVAEANGYMDLEHGQASRQWAYRHVPRRLLAEEALFAGEELIEIKYYTYGAVVEQFVISRHGDPVTSGRWQRQDNGAYALDEAPTTVSPFIDRAPLPPAVDEGLRFASQIGACFDQMRVDTMTDGETVYLGELTVYNQAGRAQLQGHYMDAPMNRSWDLRRSWFLTTQQPGWRGAYAAALRRRLDRQAEHA
jgi:hypothetical protein